MNEIVAGAPGLRQRAGSYRYDVLFLKDGDGSRCNAVVTTKEGLDQATAGEGVLYFSRLISRATPSSQPYFVPAGLQNMTIRNWNTTTRVTKMAEGRD